MSLKREGDECHRRCAGRVVCGFEQGRRDDAMMVQKEVAGGNGGQGVLKNQITSNT